jgi:hypothetical protein
MLNPVEHTCPKIAEAIQSLPRKAHWQFHSFSVTGEYVSSYMALDLALDAVRREKNHLYTRTGLRLFDALDRI